MKNREAIFREEAVEDLDAAVGFYRGIDEALGDHCFNSLIADIESLEFFAGVHSKHFGAFCLRAKRFPFNIYYHANETTVTDHSDPGYAAGPVEVFGCDQKSLTVSRYYLSRSFNPKLSCDLRPATCDLRPTPLHSLTR